MLDVWASDIKTVIPDINVLWPSHHPYYVVGCQYPQYSFVVQFGGKLGNCMNCNRLPNYSLCDFPIALEENKHGVDIIILCCIFYVYLNPRLCVICEICPPSHWVSSGLVPGRARQGSPAFQLFFSRNISTVQEPSTSATCAVLSVKKKANKCSTVYCGACTVLLVVQKTVSSARYTMYIST